MSTQYTTVTPEPSAEVVVITPDMAVDLLERNINNNRPPRQNRVNAYAEAMRRDHWALTGESIKIGRPDAEGKVWLYDGQHRLWACVEAGVPFRTFVVKDIDPAASTFIDSGIPRSMGDVVHMTGGDNAGARAAMARVILGWRAGVLHSNRQWQTTVLRDDVLRFCQDNMDTQGEALRMANQIRRQVTGTIAAIGAFVHEIERVNPAKAEEFIKQWKEGEGLTADSPVRALRQWMLSRHLSKKRTETFSYIVVMTKAWNAFIMGVPMRKMQIRKDETLPVLLSGA